jgi:hypothetical protein
MSACLPKGGLISLDQIREVLLGEMTQSLISLDDDDLRIMTSKTSVGSKISFSDFWDKCPIYNIDVGSPIRAWDGDNPYNLDNYLYGINLRDLADKSGKMPSSGPPPNSTWNFNLFCNVGSQDQDGYAIDTGTWPSTVKVVLKNPPLIDQYAKTITPDVEDSLKIARWAGEFAGRPDISGVQHSGGVMKIPVEPVFRNNNIFQPITGYRVTLKQTNPFKNFPVEGSRFCVQRQNYSLPCNGGVDCIPNPTLSPEYGAINNFRNCRQTGETYNLGNTRGFRGFFSVERANFVSANPKTFNRFENMNFIPVAGLIAGKGGDAAGNGGGKTVFLGRVLQLGTGGPALAGGQQYRGNGTLAADYGSSRSGGSAIVLNHPLTILNSGIIGSGGTGGLGFDATWSKNKPNQNANIGGGAGLPPGGFGWPADGRGSPTSFMEHPRRATFLTGGVANNTRAGDLGMGTAFRVTKPAIVTQGHALDLQNIGTGMVRGDIASSQPPEKCNLSTKAGIKIGLEGPC